MSMSPYKTRQDKLNRVFFPCLCLTEPSFPAGALQISYFKILPSKPSKMVSGHNIYKLGSNHQVINNCKKWLTSLHMEKMQLNHFLIVSIKSIEAFCCHGNQTKRQIIIILTILTCMYPSNICTKSESYCFSGFGGVVIKNPFFKI